MSSQLSPGEMVKSGLCIGCGSCVVVSPSEIKMRFDSFGELKPSGLTKAKTQDAGFFEKICPFSPGADDENKLASGLFPNAKGRTEKLGRFEAAYVGHVEEKDFRNQGSSGGMVSWVASELLRQGLIDGVAHVVPTEDGFKERRYFRYCISRTEAEILEGAKSRYYPVELSEVLKSIKENPGRYAVVGIPCFIKAVQLLRQHDRVLHERIKFTLGLFCGHMKSARFVESFAWQLKVPVEDVVKVEFRAKDHHRPANIYTAMLTLRDGSVAVKDWWHLKDGDWGAGFFMNSACNFCDDVVSETADISFGDAWVEPYSSDGRGTNVVVVRSPLIHEIMSGAIQQGKLKLEEVNAEFVEQTQAAGFRQRREGLAYRLKWAQKGVKPNKRFSYYTHETTVQRKLVYRMRYAISKWSHPVFRIARFVGYPKLYIAWARVVAAIYHGLAYHNGKPGEMIKRFKQFK